jgi:hypothetical protein
MLDMGQILSAVGGKQASRHLPCGTADLIHMKYWDLTGNVSCGFVGSLV